MATWAGGCFAQLWCRGPAEHGVADEVFGIAQGLPPHPEELTLTPSAELGWEESGEPGEAVGPVIPQYPPDE